MSLPASVAAAIVLAGTPTPAPVAGPVSAVSPAPTPHVEVVTTLADEAIDESSGAVVRGDRLFTVNDSGDGPHVYEVDLRSGRTVGVTTFADEEPVDVEALAPGAGDVLWVADVGDNRTRRDSVAVYRVVPVEGGGRVDAPRFELTYPDRPHDAETLLVDPRSGRLHVVTKSLREGARVFRAPARLDPEGPNRMEQVAALAGLFTDGTFLPGGGRVLLRTYGGAAVYTYPAFRQLVVFALPPQEQGEAVAVDRDGRVYLTSEGEGAEVLALDLPTPRPDPDGDTAPAAPPPGGDPDSASGEPGTPYDPQPWMGLGPAGLLLAALGSALVSGLLWFAVRAARRRGRRRP